METPCSVDLSNTVNIILSYLTIVKGLDPAAPGFKYLLLQNERLSDDDAEFVDVIHTAGGTLGFLEPIGHVDFFPNGGKAPQPGCGSVFDLLDYSK